MPPPLSPPPCACIIWGQMQLTKNLAKVAHCQVRDVLFPFDVKNDKYPWQYLKKNLTLACWWGRVGPQTVFWPVRKKIPMNIFFAPVSNTRKEYNESWNNSGNKLTERHCGIHWTPPAQLRVLNRCIHLRSD